MTKVDLLSRRAGYDEGENDNVDIVILKEDFFVRQVLVDIEDAGEEIKKKIKQNKGNQEKMVIEKCTAGLPGWEENEGFFLWQGRICVLRSSICCHIHERII